MRLAEGEAPAAVVGVGLLVTAVAVVWLEGDRGCPGGI